MRSEQEIRNERNRLLILEKELVKEMNDINNNDYDNTYLNYVITRANTIQSLRIVLEWVLDENSQSK